MPLDMARRGAKHNRGKRLAIKAHLTYIRVYTQEAAVPTTRGKSFKSGNSMAVRMPKEVAFEDGTELVIVRSGDVVTMYPAKKKTVSEMIAALRKLPKPPYVEERDTEEIPEPKGL